MNKKNRIQLTRYLYLFVGLISLISLVFGSSHFILGLFSHFQAQYLATFITLSTLLVIFKDYRFGFLAVIHILVLLTILPPILPYEIDVHLERQPHILSMNVNGYKETYPETIKYIDESKPEVLMLTEVPETLDIDLIEYLNDVYGTAITANSYGYTGCGIWSQEIRMWESPYSATQFSYPVCITESKDAFYIAAHPLPPITDSLRDTQLKHFNELEVLVNELKIYDKEIYLAGDFNASIYNGDFAAFIGSINGKTENIQSWFPLSPLSLAIDHIITIDVDDQYIHERTITPKLESDHRGILFYQVSR